MQKRIGALPRLAAVLAAAAACSSGVLAYQVGIQQAPQAPQAQQAGPKDAWADAWVGIDAIPPAVQAGEEFIRPERYVPYALDTAAMSKLLDGVPMEFTEEAEKGGVQIWLPRPGGGLSRFEIFETKVVPDELRPNWVPIRTFLGRGVDTPEENIRISFGHRGFRALVIGPEGVWRIDPWTRGDATHHTVYTSKEFRAAGLEPFSCTLLPADEPRPPMSPYQARASGTGLRRFDIAIACTGEFTVAEGGVANAQAEITDAVNSLNLIFERDVTVRFTLVANNNLLVYSNASTDPYLNQTSGTELTNNQNNITAVIGSANYDVGHLLVTAGGGVAQLAVVCNSSSKARGISSREGGSSFWHIRVLAHEVGHQFDADHIFHSDTGGCCCGNRNGATAYEPGSGSTIMAYAGLCSPNNVINDTEGYFNGFSVAQMDAFVDGRTCDTETATGNSIPTVNAGTSRTIPIGTPFALTATASDANGDSLTYCWEQRNTNSATPNGLSSPDDGSCPLFRSFQPTSNPTRLFPRFEVLRDNTSTTTGVEKLPSTSRTMTFWCTVRDNRAGGGGVNAAQVSITSTTAAGPFVVTSPNTNVAWGAGTTQTVTWNVANTNASPVNCANVRILLSTDRGATWPHELVASTPNDGSETVTLPVLNSTQCRIKIESIGNVFYDVSNVDFTITCPTTSAPTSVAASDGTFCDKVQITWTPPAGATGFTVYRNTTSSVSTASVIGQTTASPFDDTTANPGTTYFYWVRAENNCGLSGYSANNSGFRGTPPSVPTNVQATDGTVCNQVTVTWSAASGATSYQVLRSTTNDFASAAQVGTSATTTFADTTAVGGTTYFYWVRGVAACGTGSIGASNSGFTHPPLSAPTAANADRTQICQGDGGTISLSLTGGSGNAVQWFAASCGSTVIGTGNPLVIAAPASTTTYLGRWNSACGSTVCESVTVQVNPAPTSAPTGVASDRSGFCADDSGTISLSAGGTPQGTLTWYAGSCGGSPIGSGSPLVIASPSVPTTYFARWEASCGASPCGSVLVDVTPTVTASTVTFAASSPFPLGSSTNVTVTLSAAAPAGGATVNVTSPTFAPVAVSIASGQTSGSSSVTFTSAATGATATATPAGCSGGSAVSGAFDVVVYPVLYVSPTGSDGNIGTNPAQPLATIATAVQRLAGSGTINLAPGSYPGGVVLDRPLTLQGAGADQSTLNGAGATRVIDVTATGAVTISGVTLTGGNADSGAGLRVNPGAAVTVLASEIAGNAATISGGGIAGSGSVTLDRSTVAGNSAPTGGGIWTSSSLTLVNSTISSNTASGQGGGVFIADAPSAGSLSASYSTIAANAAAQGGGLFVASGGSADLGSVIVSGNGGGDVAGA